ncbi:DUF2242 domain-containing protein [Pseudomonas petrae]|uniref:DUF2242 domain-containing protein n=1 Tax=Pseudomonas petrae TaxID=2912190 RepID=A0ABS9I920_9PSED|nr:DUF2242 domain-containing protein [Pseudomonas petrae]MCF7533963.1 DUF2242 domain-containing protein [Pseudomonas petrae]MCF7539316.1 DUF2242 domain-containing protein [Pseudomonas petrae]MCF7543546.1 DUF2242 domain-containing protein [Pseudomonas petrae]MCF7557201.1 DUF2242 domain-containing protein [Pseudomonas petrae]
MPKLLSFRTACWVITLLAAAGCSSKKPTVYEHENFDDAGTFSRNYPVSDAATCEAARRALLSQGYIITSSDPKVISGHKSFQQTGETHMEISFNVVCAPDGSADNRTTMFANALQDRYALKKVNNSASLGVGVLGSVSMPIGSTDDSMVKVASETVASSKFYDRFFALVENFLPPELKKAAHIEEKPKTDLGMPEPVPGKPAALTEQKPAAEPASAAPTTAAPVAPAPLATPATPPAAAAEQSSEPMPAPAEAEPLKAETATPAEAAPATTPAPATTTEPSAAPAAESTPAQ